MHFITFSFSEFGKELKEKVLFQQRCHKFEVKEYLNHMAKLYWKKFTNLTRLVVAKGSIRAREDRRARGCVFYDCQVAKEHRNLWQHRLPSRHLQSGCVKQ
jgi:hypothetical protein